MNRAMPIDTTALITGAASGIGRRFAETLAERGTNLLLFDVDGPGLEAIADQLRSHRVRVVTAVVDISDRTQLARALATDEASAHRIDLLICCAAVLGGGAWIDQAPEAFDRVVQIDLLGTVNTVRAALPALKRAGGRIAILASTAAVHGWPHLAAYSAAKFGVVGFADGVRAELARAGVGLTVVFPLLIDTPLLNRADIPPILRRGRRLPPDAVVQKVLRALARRQRRVYIPGTVRLIAALHGIAPSLLDRYGAWLGLPRR